MFSGIVKYVQVFSGIVSHCIVSTSARSGSAETGRDGSQLSAHSTRSPPRLDFAFKPDMLDLESCHKK